jgi:hypothetical protein
MIMCDIRIPRLSDASFNGSWPVYNSKPPGEAPLLESDGAAGAGRPIIIITMPLTEPHGDHAAAWPPPMGAVPPAAASH